MKDTEAHKKVGPAPYHVDYTINAYLERPERQFTVLSDLHANIQDISTSMRFRS